MISRQILFPLYGLCNIPKFTEIIHAIKWFNKFCVVELKPFSARPPEDPTRHPYPSPCSPLPRARTRPSTGDRRCAWPTARRGSGANLSSLSSLSPRARPSLPFLLPEHARPGCPSSPRVHAPGPPHRAPRGPPRPPAQQQLAAAHARVHAPHPAHACVHTLAEPCTPRRQLHSRATPQPARSLTRVHARRPGLPVRPRARTRPRRTKPRHRPSARTAVPSHTRTAPATSAQHRLRRSPPARSVASPRHPHASSPPPLTLAQRRLAEASRRLYSPRHAHRVNTTPAPRDATAPAAPPLTINAALRACPAGHRCTRAYKKGRGAPPSSTTPTPSFTTPCRLSLSSLTPPPE